MRLLKKLCHDRDGTRITIDERTEADIALIRNRLEALEVRVYSIEEEKQRNASPDGTTE
jgi:hypothetical protein